MLSAPSCVMEAQEAGRILGTPPPPGLVAPNTCLHQHGVEGGAQAISCHAALRGPRAQGKASAPPPSPTPGSTLTSWGESLRAPRRQSVLPQTCLIFSRAKSIQSYPTL